MEVALIFVALFASAFGIFYMYYITRNKERMAMIDQGLELTKEKVRREPRERRSNGNIRFLLKFGMFLIGLGLGFVVASLLDKLFFIELQEIFIIGVVFIFGGAGLISGFFISRQLDKEQ